MKLMRNATVILATLVLLAAVGCAKATDSTDTTAPAEVSGLTAVAGDGQVTLTWADPADADFAGAVITYDGLATPLAVAKGAGTYLCAGLTNGVAYTFTVKTVDTSANASAGATVSATPAAGIVPDTTPPADVTGLTATPGDGQVSLFWTDPSDADLANISVSYGGPGSPVIVAKGAGTKVITGLTNGVAYTFTVKAVDTSANASTGASIMSTPVAPDLTPPAEVTGLGLVVSGSQVTLSWTEPADADFDSVRISYAGLGTPIVVAKGTTSKPITGLAAGAYIFTVKAVDVTGNASAGVASSEVVIMDIQL